MAVDKGKNGEENIPGNSILLKSACISDMLGLFLSYFFASLQNGIIFLRCSRRKLSRRDHHNGAKRRRRGEVEKITFYCKREGFSEREGKKENQTPIFEPQNSPSPLFFAITLGARARKTSLSFRMKNQRNVVFCRPYWKKRKNLEEVRKSTVRQKMKERIFDAVHFSLVNTNSFLASGKKKKNSCSH